MRTKPQLFRMASNDSAELLIYSAIGESFWQEGITGRSVEQFLKNAGNLSTVTVRINSPGGDAFEGIAIYNVLRRNGARVIVEVDALAASAASVIAMAADEIRMAKNAMMMIHEASGVTRGNAADHRATADTLVKLNEVVADTYSARTKKDKSACLDLMAAETWMTADEALEMGFADVVNPAKQAPQAHWSSRSLHAYKKAPSPSRFGARIDEQLDEPFEQQPQTTAALKALGKFAEERDGVRLGRI